MGLSILSHFHIVFFICLPISFLALFGFSREQPVWETIIKFFGLLFSFLFAFALYDPLANLFDGWFPILAYYNDLWAFIIIFILVFFVETFITDKLSKINVQLPEKENKIMNFVVLGLTFVLFYGASATFCYYLLPEKPDIKCLQSLDTKPQVAVPAQFLIMEHVVNGALAGEQSFDFSRFFQNQFNRRCAVYISVDDALKEGEKGSSDGWQFDGDSPNIE